MASQAPTFEKDRIRALKNERISSQKKTFTKWMNSFLNKSNLHVDDLFEDLADGKMLISLLEIISGEKIGVAARGKLRVHKIQNINRALDFLQKSVKLESIGAEDIIDGNEQLILGLVWMIILRFQIADISYEDEMSRERKSAKEALLLWCQRMTRGYPGVDIKNFTTSWRNGLAFNALIHKHRPDLIDYASLRPSQHEANLTNAFKVAEERLGITRLLDVEDVDCARPDDRSVMTYVSAYYQFFAKMKSEETGGRRVAKIISVLMEIEEMESTYESMVSDLLSWINNKIKDMAKPFHKSLAAVKKEMIAFKLFRTIEKPPKYAERVNIEAHLFSLQTKRTANNQKPYIPPEGSFVKDVNMAWQEMESAEHDRALALRNELIRQEMLEKMADKFERKAALRESWLDDMMHVLEEERLAQDAATVEAALKRHEAISTDVKAREERFQMVFDLAQELIDEDYHRADAVRKREEVIMTKWDKLVNKLQGRCTTLMGLRDLVGVFRDMDSAHSDMMDIETGLRSEDYGRHLLDVENILQKHSLLESQIQAQGERIQKINVHALAFVNADHPETKVIKERQKLITQAYQALVQLGKERRARLEDSLKLYKFFGDLEEEDIFIKETEQLASSKEVGKDLASLTRFQQRHEALDAEISGRLAHCEQVCARGQSLIDKEHFASKEIKAKIKQVQGNWIRVKELSQNRRERLKDAAQSLQYYSDANDAESWMKEKLSVVKSDDYGRDEQSATSLLQRHRQVQEEISSFADDISRLKEQSKLMGESSKEATAQSQPTYESYTEEMEVETDEEVEETIEKEILQDVVREVKVPQVIVLYPYAGGQGLAVEKGEALYLINKTNKDWWSVRRTKTKEAGYVPAKYVKEIEPRVVQKTTKQKVMVPQTVKVKRKVKKMVSVERQRPVPANTAASPRSPRRGKLKRGLKRHFTAHFDRDNVAVRQITLTNTYNRLLEVSKIREQNLENAIKFYHFSRECDDMDVWMTNKEKQLNSKDSLQAGDIIQTIRKNLERFQTEVSAKNSSMSEINRLADELINNGHYDVVNVKRRRKELNERWGRLQQLNQQKEEELEEKHGVELFFNSCEEMRSWIKEKDGMLYDEDVGRDIETVRALQRRHQGVERDLAAVEDKVTKLKAQAQSLVSQHPRQGRQIKAREEEIIRLWNGLKTKAAQRKAVLDDAYGQQGFLADTRDLLSWANEVTQSLNSAEDPHDISSAEAMTQKHNEMLEDIQTHLDRFDRLNDYSQKLLSANPRAVKVKQNVASLNEAKDKLSRCWAERNDRLQQAQDLQVFIRDAEHLDAATASHEAYFANKDLGATVDDVERLLKKHEDMDKTLLAQDERVRDLSDMATSLIRAQHFEKNWISKRRDEVVQRRKAVKHHAGQRRESLIQSQLLQNFLRDADEFGAWIFEKSQIATDESYRDPKNIQGKLQRHEAFEAEITANKDGIDRINTVGKNLIHKKHFGSKEVQMRLKTLNQDWQELLASSSSKGCKLHQAHSQMQFNRSLGDFIEWMHDVEALLGSEDLGRDLSSVKFLLKKHQLVEADIEVHVTEAQALSRQAQELIDDNHFNAKDIQRTMKDSLKRFKDLKSLSSSRRAQLEDSFGLNQLFYDIEMEMAWVREHEQLATSGDLGSNLVSVQRLQKRHLAFENELTNHEPKIKSALTRGQDLIDSCHHASDKVEERIDELRTAWGELLEATAHRKLKLDESHESQKYFAEANEADSWMNDKAGLAASQDYGKDDAATEKLLTRHKALETDVESISTVITNLGKDARRLVESGHFDANKVKLMQRDLEEQLSGLRTLVSSRRLRLDESKKLHHYMREVDETAEWINDQLHIAGSEDYGKDFEHLETVQNKFDDFQGSVGANTKTYRAVDNLAKKLVAEGHTDTVAIKEQQDILRSMWAQLQDQIELRKKRLKSAAEIHRFNRDLNELISRIQEKDANLTLDDLGRDLASAQALQRKHDVFERELVAVEQQVKTLITESRRLQNTYKGQTAQTIQNHEQSLLGLWEELKRKSSRKKHKLRDNIALHKLNNSIRDQVTWCIDMGRVISSDEPIHNLSDAEAMLRRLEEQHVVMESREETFTRLLETGEKMIEDGHFASEELTERLELLLTERESLYATWDDRKTEVDQACDLHVFLRDARQVDSLYSSQEAVLAKAELGNSVDEVDFLLKKHENVEKLVLSQDEKVNALNTFGKQLLESKHKDSSMISQRLTVINERRNKLKKDLRERRVKLEDSRKISQFYQDVIEAESWIVEKLQTALDECYKDPSNLVSKVQKHQAFEAELTAHRGVIDAVQRNGEELISSGHFAANEVESRIESLYIQWEELLEASENKAKKLEEARDHKMFNQEVDIADSCIADKEAIVSSEDIGRDYDHCIRLQKKMNEFDQDLAVEEDRVYTINHLADKLINQGHAGGDLIYRRQQALNERWNALQDKASERRQRLAEACEIHAFDQSCVEIANMINEKVAILSTNDLGRDLPGVEALIRKHDDVERALTVIENKMEMLENEAHRLVRSQPHMARTVQNKQTEIIENWERLNDKFDERKSQLEANRLRQIFLVDYRDVMSWMSDLASKISSGELAKSVQDAQALLDLHKERKSEIEARQETINATLAFGLTLIAQNNFAEEVQEDNENLKEMNSKLQELWVDRQQMLQQSYELEVFLASAEQADNWITNKQAVAIDNESKDSLDTVESLLKNQVNFEKSIAAYEESIKSLETSAQLLINKAHYDSDIITSRRDEVLDKWAKLKRMVAEKSEQLGESKLLFQFLRDAKELESWINEKLQTAAEASYREAKHLNLKLQKHQTFEAEVSANRGQLESVIKDGNCLINTSPTHCETVEKRLKDLSDLWTLLEDLSANKAKRLKEAIQKQTFERNVTELETWIDEIEYALAIKEYGKDLKSVKNLIKKHGMLEEGIVNHEDRVRELLQQAEEFEEAGHFQKEEIGERAADVAERFDQLSSPAAERKEKLQDSLVLHQFLNDAQAETDWLREKESLVSSEDYGHNLNGVQNLLKKHEAFEAEFTTHEQLVQAVMATANDVITRGHYASGVIMEHSSKLQTSWNEFHRLTQIRKTKLKESLATQQYYSQVSEVEAWVQEKLPFVSNEDYGRDETSAQALLRRHEMLELEFERFGKKIDELRSLCNTLVLGENFDAENVKQRQRELEDRYSELSDISSYRHRRLLESSRLLNFLREVDEVEAWIEEKETIVTSDDCGRDLEHVDMLMEKFEAFTRDLVMSGERVAKLTAHAQELLNDEHSDSETIEQRAEQICTRWDVLKERTNERLDALDRAKDLHTFNRNVEETNAWIQEKEATLMHTDDGALDLSSVQALQRKHEGFQRDLTALGEKVSSLSQDADMLIDKLPQNRNHFAEQKQMIIEAWQKLQQRATSKKSVLSQSEGLQSFLNDYRDLMAWIDTMASSIASREVAADFASAEKLFAQHQEYRTEVAAHEKSVQEFQEAAQKLIKSGHPNSTDIKEKSQSVKDAWSRLLESVDNKQDHLEQVREVQRFKREADQLEGWLYARGSDILSEDVGDSLEAVEELLKKQDEFEKMLLAKGEHFEDLTRLTNQEMENEKLKIKKEREMEKQKEMERQMKKKQEKERLEKERRRALREEEERKRKEFLEEQQQEEKRRQEQQKRDEEIKQKQLDMQIKQEELKRKEREKNRIDREKKKILEEKRKEDEKRKMLEEEQRIEEAKIQQEQLSMQSSSPAQQDAHNICEGFLQRKHELDQRGQRPGIRGWKTFYTTLADGKLEFFSDKSGASRQETHASHAINLKGASCTAFDEAMSGNNAFRLQLENDSVFLFNSKSEKDSFQWISEINKCIEKHSQVSRPSLQSPRPPNLLPTTNDFPVKNEKIARPQTPVIKVTSFDSDEAIENDDNVNIYVDNVNIYDNGEENDDDDDIIDGGDLLESFTALPPDVPPPVVPEDIDINFEPDTSDSTHKNHDKTNRDTYPEDIADEYTDILSEEDIHPEFYPDAPTDFNDNMIPDIPCIPPPDVPPFDLGDLEEGAVDEDDLIDYPKAPPPPGTFPKEPAPSLGLEEAAYLSSGSEGLPSTPTPLVPTKPDACKQPSRPSRKKRAPPPPREARYRSDSRDSDDFSPNVLPPKPPVKPKPKPMDSHDDKKHEKKKGMFGFLKKKK